MTPTKATAFAPATVGNAAVGFDVLGFAVDAVGDSVTVSAIDEPIVRISEIDGVVSDLPRDPAENTATVGLVALRADHDVTFGFDVSIHKGIPLGSGMGGSAASAVAAVVAANAVLGNVLSAEQMFDYALQGEEVASGHAHPDNVAPCLYGGLTYAVDGKIRNLPTPGLWVTLVHPELRIDTKIARGVLPREIPLSTAVGQLAYIAAFVDACHRNDADAAAFYCRDLLAEPHRKALVPGFADCKSAASDAGALCFSLSGSGPTVFALSPDADAAERARLAIIEAFANSSLKAEGWVSKFGAQGARLT